MPLWTIAQYKEIQAKVGIFWEKNCPFCGDKKDIRENLWNGTYWYITRNAYPYSGDDNHLMAIPHRHLSFSSELTIEELAELKDVHQFAKEYYWESAYFSCTRESMHNRSVEHLHTHFVPGKLQKEWIIKMLWSQGFPVSSD